MSIANRLLDLVELDGEVTDVRVGIRWTIVVIETMHGRQAGLASTQVAADLAHGTPAVRAAGELIGKRGAELAAWILEDSLTERSIGFAALNALIRADQSKCVELNAETLIMQRGRGKHVAIVGHFPFVPQLRQVAARTSVLELNPVEGDLPAAAAPEVIPTADVVAITGMTLVNGTFEELVSLCRPGAFVLLLGATTPLAPLLFEYGVDAISGTVVDDIALATAAVSQGANFRQIRGKRLLTLLEDARLTGRGVETVKA